MLYRICSHLHSLEFVIFQCLNIICCSSSHSFIASLTHLFHSSPRNLTLPSVLSAACSCPPLQLSSMSPHAYASSSLHLRPSVSCTHTRWILTILLFPVSYTTASQTFPIQLISPAEPYPLRPSLPCLLPWIPRRHYISSFPPSLVPDHRAHLQDLDFLHTILAPIRHNANTTHTDISAAFPQSPRPPSGVPTVPLCSSPSAISISVVGSRCAGVDTVQMPTCPHACLLVVGSFLSSVPRPR